MKNISKTLLLIPISTLLLSACTSTPPTTSPKIYTLNEVSMHTVKTDCWMIVNQKVYDVTKFIPTHPGGKSIIKGCGIDATLLFEQRPNTDKGPHPESATETLKNYYIGELNK